VNSIISYNYIRVYFFSGDSRVHSVPAVEKNTSASFVLWEKQLFGCFFPATAAVVVTAAVAGEIAASATAVDSVTAASTAAVLQRAKVAVWERRTSASAQIIARRRDSEGSEVLRGPDPVVSELEITWTSEEREELDCTNREIDEDVMEPDTPWIR
jgi:hypothetical protein